MMATEKYVAAPRMAGYRRQSDYDRDADGGVSGSSVNGGRMLSAGNRQPLNPVIDLKVILSKEEVSYLFGFDGVLIQQLRQQTGANIGITDGDSHEYVLCIGGSIDIIFKAFSLVCRKLWDFLTGIAGPNHQRPLTLRLAVPSSQCGSIIGKQGSKVKEIRDLTNANIQVSQESLPDSTERCVDVSGSGEACLQSTYHICSIMQDTPLRGEVIPYIPPKRGSLHNSLYGFRQPNQPHPMEQWRPVFLCGDKAYVIDGRVARPAPPELLRNELAKTQLGGGNAAETAERGVENGDVQQQQQQQRTPDHMNPLALIAAISKSQQNGGNSTTNTSREMTVNPEFLQLLLCNGGQKLEEIQRMSGAQVHVGGSDGSGELQVDRMLTVSGSEESVLLAQFLIQSNVDLMVKQQNRQEADFVQQNSSSSSLNTSTMLPNPNLGSHAFENVGANNQTQLQQSNVATGGGGRFNDRRTGRASNRNHGKSGRKSPGIRTGGGRRGNRR